MGDGNPGVVGDVELGPNGEQDLKAGFIAGTLVVDPTAENIAPETVIEAGIDVRDLYQAAVDALQFSSDAANLAPTQGIKDLKDTQTIERNGTLTLSR